MDPPQIFSRYSAEIMQFSWGYVAIWATIVVGVAFSYWWTVFGPGNTIRMRIRNDEADERLLVRRLDSVREALRETVAEARHERDKALAAALMAEAASDGASARLASAAAQIAAKRASEAAEAASMAANSLLKGGKRGSSNTAKARQVPTDADDHAAAAQAAAERAERTAVAKGG